MRQNKKINYLCMNDLHYSMNYLKVKVNLKFLIKEIKKKI